MERRSDGTERAGENMKCMEGGEKMEETRGGVEVEGLSFLHASASPPSTCMVVLYNTVLLSSDLSVS